MPAVRPIAMSLAVAITSLLIATIILFAVVAPHDADAQTSMGAPDPLPPPAPSMPSPAPYVAPPLAPTQPPLNQPAPSTEFTWGAIGFTADGSYSTTWKMPSQAEAEARVANGCAEVGHGGC